MRSEARTGFMIPICLIALLGLRVQVQCAALNPYARSSAQTHSDSLAGKTAEPHPGATSFKFKFENSRFYIPLIEIDIAADGSGELRFRRGEADEIIERRLKLLPATLARINQLIARVRFLDSHEDYQSEKDFSHLGWVTITARQSERERTVRFNYTKNQDVSEIAEIFRAIANQEIALFDIELAQRYQPLSIPQLLDALESDLHFQRVAEPTKLLATLRELSSDDTLPLIARNKAKQIAEQIEKKRFKSPMRSER
jgi:hypothetical protein